MAEGLEHVLNLITRYAIFENLYLHVDSAIEDQLADAIVRLYTAILTYLSKASRYYHLNTIDQRMLKRTNILHDEL